MSAVNTDVTKVNTHLFTCSPSTTLNPSKDHVNTTRQVYIVELFEAWCQGNKTIPYEKLFVKHVLMETRLKGGRNGEMDC